MTVDRKGKPAIGGVRLHAKLTMLVNEIPRLPDASGALGSRPIFVNFPNSYEGREDRTLEPRLMSELPGITLWALDGLKDLRSSGKLVQPAAGHEIQEEFVESSSAIVAFVKDCCQVGEGKKVLAEVLFRRYLGWCDECNVRNPVDVRHFGIQLRAYKGLIKRRRESSGERKWYYTGIDLNAHDRRLVTCGLEVVPVLPSEREEILRFIGHRLRAGATA